LRVQPLTDAASDVVQLASYTRGRWVSRELVHPSSDLAAQPPGILELNSIRYGVCGGAAIEGFELLQLVEFRPRFRFEI
jgi:hypothetical protein